MLDPNVIKKAKKKAEVNKENIVDKYQSLVSEGINTFTNAYENEDFELMKKSSESFFKALEISKNHYEPYFFISSIFMLFGQKEDALRYLEYIENLEHDEEIVQKLRNEIINQK